MEEEAAVALNPASIPAVLATHVTAHAGEIVLRKTVVATGEGRFVARWQQSIAGGCHSTTVSAVGSRGSRAVYKIVVNDCAPLQPNDR